MSGIGATSPLPRVAAKVLLHPICGLSPSCGANRWFAEFTTYALASCLRASWMEARVTKVAWVSARFSKSLAVSSEPGEGALDHPTARQNDEAPHVVAPLNDLHAQPRRLCHRSFNLPRVVVA